MRLRKRFSTYSRNRNDKMKPVSLLVYRFPVNLQTIRQSCPMITLALSRSKSDDRRKN
jgi:hypothetical protein